MTVPPAMSSSAPMSARRMVSEVALREIRSRARTRSFRVITVFLAVVAVAGPLLLAFFPEGDDDLREVTIGVGTDVDAALIDMVDLLAVDRLDIEYLPLADITSNDVDAALTGGEIDVAVEADDTLAWNESVDVEIASVVEGAMQQQAALERGAASGLDADETQRVLTPLDVVSRFVDAPDTSDDGVRMAIAMIGLMIAFMLPQIFGQLTLLSVVEEKATGVIEVLLSHITPRTLLVGKVLGLSFLALIQLAVVIVGLAAAMFATNRVDIPSSAWQFLPVLAVSVIGGLLFYNTLFALLGSLISRQEDASQVMLPIFLPLMGGFFVGQFSALGQPDTLVARVLTYIPFTSPMLLPVRVARDGIATWEVAASLLVLGVSVWLLIRVAGRVYQFTLLHAGSRVGWKQAWKFARGTALTP